MAPNRRNKRITNNNRYGQDSGTTEEASAWRMVRAFNVPNYKYINTLYNTYLGLNLLQTAPIIQILNGIAQGTTENTRIGRSVRMKWLDLNLQFYMAGVSSQFGANLVRAYVIVETTSLGSLPSMSQFLADNTTFHPLAQRDRANRNAQRFKVLWDSGPKTIYPPSVPSGQTAPVSSCAGPNQHTWSLHIPLEFDTDYSRGNAGTQADIDTNSLSLVLLTDSGTNNAVFATYTWTLCFSDLKR
jgi:hypothetical protein